MPLKLTVVLCFQADQRFVWNGHLLRELTQQPELGKYCLPMILGCILSQLAKQNSGVILSSYDTGLYPSTVS